MSWSGGICSLAIFGLIVVFGGVGGAMAGWSAITEGIVYRFAEFLLRPLNIPRSETHRPWAQCCSCHISRNYE